MKSIIIIPARYNSSRFPGKPLAEISGKSMINRVYEQALKFTSTENIYIATDDERIYKHVKNFTENVFMTSLEHQSGTDRCGEVIENINSDFDIVINIQGDEPFINFEQLSVLEKLFENEKIQIATLCKKINSNEELLNPNIVKVIKNNAGRAFYFSRLPIPYLCGEDEKIWHEKQNYFKHLGIYAFRKNILKEIIKLKQTPLEISESLEQLRWLENDYTIYVAETEYQSMGIDTPDDIEKAEFFLNNL